MGGELRGKKSTLQPHQSHYTDPLITFNPRKKSGKGGIQCFQGLVIISYPIITINGEISNLETAFSLQTRCSPGQTDPAIVSGKPTLRGDVLFSPPQLSTHHWEFLKTLPTLTAACLPACCGVWEHAAIASFATQSLHPENGF